MSAASDSSMISMEPRRFEKYGRNEGEWVGPEDESIGVYLTVAGQSAIDRAVKMLSGIEGGLEKAVRSAMSRAASHLRSSSAKAIQQRYAISAANIRANENVRVEYSLGNGLRAEVAFMGARIPLHRFMGASPSQPTRDMSEQYGVMIADQKWRRMYPGVAASGHVLKGTSPARFSHAFVMKTKTGHVGIFERTGGMTRSSKDELEEIFGPSVPTMLGSDEVGEDLAREAMDKFEERLDHEINAILNGWR